jgi:hypothetical protein
MPTPQIRTLKRALEKLKDKARLAAALKIPLEELEDYLLAKKPVPNSIFLIALDIVAERR